jgi:hypothetical protein
VARHAIRHGSPSDAVIWSSTRPWWQRYQGRVSNDLYLSWEADAHRAHEWAALRIPDLLLTPNYTQALLKTDRVFCAQHMVSGRLNDKGALRIADEIESRKQRQDRLLGQPDQPLNYVTVIEEAALRRVVGNPAVMRAQLLALLDYAGYTSVTVLVMPEKASPQTGTDGGFVLLDFADPLQAPTMLFAHYPGGVVAEHERHVVEQARQRWDAVLAAALPETDSAEVIEQLADQLYPQ